MVDDIAFRPARYEDLNGWDADDFRAAFAAFRTSSPRVLAAAQAQGLRTRTAEPGLLAACEAATWAVGTGGAESNARDARLFFETWFVPHVVVQDRQPGLLTGYYEPSLPGVRDPDPAFPVPLLKRPPELINIVDDTERAGQSAGLTHGRRTPEGVAPYFTRAEIEDGALKDQGLELAYLADPVDTFFMHVQGSGRIELPDGTAMRVTYDGKNGYPYTSVGKYVADAGYLLRAEITLAALKDWLQADPQRGRAAMHQNASYIFFRELTGEQAGAPLGSLEIPLSTGRSLAVDPRYHTLGTPIFVTAPDLTHADVGQPFRRLMVAQDVGSAIAGPERGDIYFGSGFAAGELAGITQHRGYFTVLLPRAA